jgi:LuxR family maltose regulon positive regulatory protein
MDRTSLLQSDRETPRAPGPAFDLSAAKLLRPEVRPGCISRSALIERLARNDSCPIVSVVAPAGYGKTTLLAQWAERNGQASAWLSVDEADNDPKVLLSYIAEALNAVEPISRRVFDALASPVSSVPGTVVPRLGNAFASMTAPVALVLDDVHLLRNAESRAALSVLADHVPDGSRLVLAGRAEPPLRVARLRAEGRLLEIGPDDLSLTRDEASTLLRAADVPLGDDEVAALYRRTEGWAAALYLAALYIREGGTPEDGAAASGGDWLVNGYVESEFLARMSQPQRQFLTRTAVLERMCGPLCEAVLEVPGSADVLAGLARSNMLLIPLDRRGHWYRYHHLLRDMLRAELECLEPDLVPVLQRRAAAWYLRNDMPEAALECSMAAGDVNEAAQLMADIHLRTYRQGRHTTIRRWYRWLVDRGGLQGRPMAAVQAAELAAISGQAAEAEQWADAVDRWQDHGQGRFPTPAHEAWAAAMRAVLCRHGIERMRADADAAARGFAAGNSVVPVVALLQGVARVLSGDAEGGDAFFDDAISVGHTAAPDVLADVLCERSLLAMGGGHWDRVEALAGEAAAVLRRTGTEDSYAGPLVSALQARIALHHGDVPAARRELVTAQRLRPLLTYAIPHLAVQARIELAHINLALGDIAGARMLMREIDEILKRRPGLGTLVGEARALRARLSETRGPATPGASALTAAELRVLPLLATHLSFPEIGRDICLSQHTVKSQAMSIYRKLGATSRSQAVALARELGLLEG